MTEGITVTLSLSRKVNLGNYNSADVFMSLNAVPVGAPQAEIDAALVTGKVMFETLRVAVNEKAEALRSIT